MSAIERVQSNEMEDKILSVDSMKFKQSFPLKKNMSSTPIAIPTQPPWKFLLMIWVQIALETYGLGGNVIAIQSEISLQSQIRSYNYYASQKTPPHPGNTSTSASLTGAPGGVQIYGYKSSITGFTSYAEPPYPQLPSLNVYWPESSNYGGAFQIYYCVGGYSTTCISGQLPCCAINPAVFYTLAATGEPLSNPGFQYYTGPGQVSSIKNLAMGVTPTHCRFNMVTCTIDEVMTPINTSLVDTNNILPGNPGGFQTGCIDAVANQVMVQCPDDTATKLSIEYGWSSSNIPVYSQLKFSYGLGNTTNCHIFPKTQENIAWIHYMYGPKSFRPPCSFTENFYAADGRNVTWESLDTAPVNPASNATVIVDHSLLYIMAITLAGLLLMREVVKGILLFGALWSPGFRKPVRFFDSLNSPIAGIFLLTSGYFRDLAIISQRDVRPYRRAFLDFAFCELPSLAYKVGWFMNQVNVLISQNSMQLITNVSFWELVIPVTGSILLLFRTTLILTKRCGEIAKSQQDEMVKERDALRNAIISTKV